MKKNDITDKDKFLSFAADYDENNNDYLTEAELKKAASDYVSKSNDSKPEEETIDEEAIVEEVESKDEEETEDDTGTSGIGFQAQVDEIVGIGVSKIETVLTRFENAVFEWKDSREVVANHLPFIELNDQDNVVISGLSTSIVNLTDSFKVGVRTDTISLGKTMAVNTNAAGVIET